MFILPRNNNIPFVILTFILTFLIANCGSNQPADPTDQAVQDEVLMMDRNSSNRDTSAKLSDPYADPPDDNAVIEGNPAEIPLTPVIAEDSSQVPDKMQPESEPQVESELLPDSELPPVEPAVGYSAPDFSLTTTNGTSISLAELKGKNVVINYWVTWCVPCMEELTALENLHRLYQDQNIVLLTVNGIEQDNINEVEQTINDLGLTFPILLDEGENFWKSYQVLFLPTSFFIDENGIIRNIMFGGDTEADFRLRIDQLISDQL